MKIIQRLIPASKRVLLLRQPVYRIEGNASMFVVKTFSGLNQNALKYLLPRWMDATSGVVFSGKWFAPVLTADVFSVPFMVLLFVLIFPSSISYLLTDIGLKILSATVVAMYANRILIVSAIMSYVLGQDHFSWWQILSMILIIASVTLVEKAESHDRTNSVCRQ